MPDQAGDGGDADQEHDRPGGEQEAQESQQQAHYRRSVSPLRRIRRTASLMREVATSARLDQRRPADGQQSDRFRAARMFIELRLWPN